LLRGSEGRSVRYGTKEGGMLKEVYESYNELDSRLREAVVLKKAGFFLAEDLLLVPVPNGKGGNKLDLIYASL
jgi:hypothetical protein